MEADFQDTQGRKVQGKRLDLLEDSLGGAQEERLETSAPHRGSMGPQTTSKITSSARQPHKVQL